MTQNSQAQKAAQAAQETAGTNVQEGNMRQEWLPLYTKPQGAFEPFDAYIVVDVRTGKLYTVNSAPGAGSTIEAVRGRELWISVSPRVLGGALHKFLTSDKVRGLVQRIVDGTQRRVEGGAAYYLLNDDAEDALLELEELAEELPEGVVYDPWEVLSEDYEKRGSLHYINNELVTKDNLHSLLNIYPTVWHEHEQWYFSPGLHTLITDMAAENETILTKTKTER